MMIGVGGMGVFVNVAVAVDVAVGAGVVETGGMVFVASAVT
jgi:hypothetical protein